MKKVSIQVPCCFGSHELVFGIRGHRLCRIWSTCSSGAELFVGSCAYQRSLFFACIRSKKPLVKLSHARDFRDVSDHTYNVFRQYMHYVESVRRSRLLSSGAEPDLGTRWTSHRSSQLLGAINVCMRSRYPGWVIRYYLPETGALTVRIDYNNQTWAWKSGRKNGQVPLPIMAAVAWALEDSWSYSQFKEFGIDACLTKYCGWG